MKGLILLAICLLASNLVAQTVFFNHITQENGLRSGNVRTIVKDYQGFVWIGTEDGLHRYDGYGMKVYRNREGDSTSISSNFILCLFEDSNQNLWVGTLGGSVCLYDRKSDSFRCFNHENPPIPGNAIRAIAEGRDHKLYIASNGLTRATVEPGTGSVKFESLHFPGEQNTKETIRVLALAENLDGSLLISAYPFGVFSFDCSTGTFTRHALSQWDNNVLGMYADKRRGVLWAGTWHNGLLVYEPATKRHTILKANGTPGGLVNGSQLSAMAADSAGNLWIASDHGLIEFPHNQNPFQKHTIITHLPDEKKQSGIYGSVIKAVYIDNQDKLWVGCYYEGVNVYDKRSMNFGTLTVPPAIMQGERYANVSALQEDAQHNTWIGTDGAGLFRLQGTPAQNRETDLEPVPQCTGSKVKALKLDADGNLWIGTWGEGLLAYNVLTRRCKKFDDAAFNTSIGQEIIALGTTKPGHLWIGTFDHGLFRYAPKTNELTHIENEHKSKNITDRISVIFADAQNNVWTGKEGGGLHFCSQGTTINKAILTEHLTRSTTITSLHRDAQGIVWVGVPNEGLVAYNPQTNRSTLFGERLGLANSVVQAIQEDSTGRLWLATNTGISLFEKETRKFSNFTRANGLSASQFNRGSALTTHGGTMVFGNIRGLNYFSPGQFKHHDQRIGIALLKLSVNNIEQVAGREGSVLQQNITVTREISLQHNQNSFSIEFAALDFNFTNLTEYAYKLEDFDETWQFAGAQRSIAYTNLPAGDYTLKIRATNTKYGWSPHIAELRVVIVPAWWQTTWFKVVLAATIVLAAIAIHRIRIRYLVDQQRRLEALVRERTRKLSDANSQLHTTLEELKATNLLLSRQHDEIAEKTNEIQAQNEELMSQNEHIFKQQERLLETQKQLQEVNISLERVVDERTLKLQHSIQDLNKTVFELDRFVYSASHDLSAPLKSIRGLVEIIHLEQDPAKVYIYADYIKDTVLKLETVIKSMVDYSRNVHIQLKSEPFSLHELVAEVISELAFWPATVELSYLNEIPSGLVMQSDRSRLKVVLHNLISNSIKYADKRKESSWIRLECEPNGQHWKLCITDNGIGIREEYLDKIFNMYFRATDASKGSGLGLFIVKETLTKIGGSVKVHSTLGVQTSFELLIPQVETSKH